jgi:hypothetical protein
VTGQYPTYWGDGSPGTRPGTPPGTSGSRPMTPKERNSQVDARTHLHHRPPPPAMFMKTTPWRRDRRPTRTTKLKYGKPL